MVKNLKKYTTQRFRRIVKIYVLFLFILGAFTFLKPSILELQEYVLTILIAIIFLFCLIIELLILISVSIEKDLDRQSLEHNKLKSRYIEFKYLVIEHIEKEDS